MKYKGVIMKTAICFLLFLAFASCSNVIKPGLQDVSGGDGKVCVFGQFIQRLGFESGGYPQNIFIRGEDTNRIINIEVKPTWTSSKTNYFYLVLKPGKYEFLKYFYSGGYYMHIQMLVKDPTGTFLVTHTNIDPKGNNFDFPKYVFTVPAVPLCYVGSWDFTGILPEFRNNLSNDAAVMKEYYPETDFKTAVVSIPK